MSKLSDVEVGYLASIAESLMAMSGRYGSRVIGDATARTGLHVTSISIREDATTFATLKCQGDGTELGATFFLGGAAATKAGDLWTSPAGYRFTEIDLASGSIQITGPNIGT